MVAEANREEAMRAMDIAVKKMENKDFVGALKVAAKAQKLCPDIENVSQLISVCEVHCSAENKVFVGEKDWYNILKIDPTADEAAIKKQYRKLALSLHPDKNKFAGATDAFKLIGEAQRVLLDPTKRMLYDTKRRGTGLSQINRSVPQTSRQPNIARQHPWVHATSPFVNQQPQQPQQPQSRPSTRQTTFWTVCPFCSVRYEYYREVLNKTLSCQSCKKTFTAYEMNAPRTKPGVNSSQPAFSQKKDSMSQDRSKVAPQTTSVNQTSRTSFQSDNRREKQARETFVKPGGSEVGEGSKPRGKRRNADVKGNKGPVETRKRTGKRRKIVEESSESYNSGSSSESEEELTVGDGSNSFAAKDFEYNNDRYPRRSTRSRQNVSYNENLSDNDELADIFKQSKGRSSESKEADDIFVDLSKDEKETTGKESSSRKDSFQNGQKKIGSELLSDPSPVTEIGPETYEYPDPDFSDFDKDRTKEYFKAGQLWAVYDIVDAMPRFYALIKKVYSSGFKLAITWLEPDPDDEEEIKWVGEGLPASCGIFKCGNPDITEDHPMFSHLVNHEKGRSRTSFKIYPRKGETWALFKNWDMKWYSHPNARKRFEFEFVEVLSDYEDGLGVLVTYLVKLKGFSCIFCRKSKERDDSFWISTKEIFRFSHRVPSYQMTGEEREDVPEGSFELDPASLPSSQESTNAVSPEDHEAE